MAVDGEAMKNLGVMRDSASVWDVMVKSLLKVKPLE